MIPLRSDEDELLCLESAALDEIEDQDERQAGDDVDTKVEWLARHEAPRRPSPPA